MTAEPGTAGAELPLSVPLPPLWGQQLASQPPTALTLLGDADAEVCVDGVCEVAARD